MSEGAAKKEEKPRKFQAIRGVLGGKLYLSDKMAMMMTEKFVDGRPKSTGSVIENLSDRELEVFQLLGRGYTTRQIAAGAFSRPPYHVPCGPKIL